MSNDINKIKQLRKSTGAGFKDCSAALQEGNENIEKAIKFQINNKTKYNNRNQGNHNASSASS